MAISTDDRVSRPLRIEEAASILRTADLELVEWTDSGSIPCARVKTRGRQYLVPLGVVAQLVPRLLVV
jgi:excisionase family DNA binding protein